MESLQTVQQIFSDKLFRVPDYQRGYTWEKKQWQDLIDDLEELPEGKEHYTGTIILNLTSTDKLIKEERGKQLGVYNIVDGQQRLTTILLLLSCISKEFKGMGTREALARGIREDFIEITDFEGQRLTRLTLNKDCQEFYKKNIISEDTTIHGPEIKSHELLYGAKEYFANYIKAKKENIKEFERYLLDFHNKITNNQ